MTPLTTMTLSENARVIFDKRYSRKDDDGNPTELPEETVERVVFNVASVNALYLPKDQWLSGMEEGGSASVPADEFPYCTARRQYDWLCKHRRDDDRPSFDRLMYQGWDYVTRQVERYREMLLHRDFFPNSPTWTGAGTPLGQLAACFVLPIDDDLASGRAAIFNTLSVAALIQQTGGGNGFSFGRLRPSNALVKRSMGRASGPVGFLRAYDAAFGEIGQGGTRRGANMGVLPVWHPDVRAFIAAKVEEGHVANFNISVAITDEFMEAVEKDADFDLRWRLNGATDDEVEYEIRETIRARDLYDEIIASAWKLGDPGNLFIDRANQTNPCPAQYVLEATNPCGEQWLPPYSNCCLGSINLANFADWGPEGRWEPSFDWSRLAKVTMLAQNFLDDVVDANQYVPEVPELEEAAMNERRIGLGIMGLADAMAIMGVSYDSEEGREFAAQVMEFVEYHTMWASILRARDRGSFEWFEGSIYNLREADVLGEDACIMGLDGERHDFWTPPTPLDPFTRDFKRPSLDWSMIEEALRDCGLRNACYLTIAPTGTISNVADLHGSGGEPFFGLAYDRVLTQETERITLTYANPLIAEALRRCGKSEAEIFEIANRIKENYGSCRGVTEVPFEVQRAFPVAADIPGTSHVQMQAVLQRFVDNSISKTINLPNSATVEDVGIVYRMAYDLGCKGITIYRQGSRQVEVLSTGVKTEDRGTDWPFVHPHRIPDYSYDEGLPTRTYPVPTPFGTAQVYVTELPEHPGRPFDVRIGFGKAGNDKLGDVEAIGRMISICLRAGVPVEVIVDQLEGIGGQTVTGFGPRRVRSVADGVAKLLRRRYMVAEETITVEVAGSDTRPYQSSDETLMADPTLVCPLCHQGTVVNESGCQRCDLRLGGCGDYYKCD